MYEKTWQRLEYDRVKMRVSEYAMSELGRQHIEQMSPLTQLKAVQTALDETTEAMAILRNGASVPIPSLTGMTKILGLLGTGYLFTEEDFMNLHQFLYSTLQLKKYMSAKRELAPRVSMFASSLYELEQLRSEIERCIRHGAILDTASKDLHRIRKKIDVLEQRLMTRLQNVMNKHRNILQESIISMRGDRYVLPVQKEHRKRMAGSVLDESASGQTVYIEPAEVQTVHAEIRLLRADEVKEEAKILAQLTELTEQYATELRLNTETIGIYDYIFARAKYARAIDGQSVTLNADGIIDVREARHPLINDMIPHDIRIGERYRTLIITGPNTGGKTVALKTVGLLTLMVQSGIPVPVREGSRFAVFSQVGADIGDGQSIEQSLSTFSAHVRNMIDMLKTADAATLILIDEMATGTDPGEGVGLSIAILEELYERGATVIATTHYNEIKHYADKRSGFENARMEFDTETLRPLYRLRIGEAGRSYALVIARNLGMPDRIIRRSEELMNDREEQRHTGIVVDEVSESVDVKKVTNVVEEHDAVESQDVGKSMGKEIDLLSESDVVDAADVENVKEKQFSVASQDLGKSMGNVTGLDEVIHRETVRALDKDDGGKNHANVKVSQSGNVNHTGIQQTEEVTQV